MFTGLLAELRLILAPLDRQDVGGPWLRRNRELMELLTSGDGDVFRERLQRYLDDSRREVLAVLEAPTEGATP